MNLGDLCNFAVDDRDADFWMVRTGPSVGKPVEQYHRDHIAVKVTRTDLLVPRYLYYMMLNLHLQGAFSAMENIRPEDLRQIQVQPQG